MNFSSLNLTLYIHAPRFKLDKRQSLMHGINLAHDTTCWESQLHGSPKDLFQEISTIIEK